MNAKTLPDQADGLRRLFAAGSRARFVPVLSNPHVVGAGALLEGLCAAYTELGLHTLVVDAGELGPEPAEMAAIDLGACIEPLSQQVSYLAARGLPLRYINANGSAAQFLEAVAAVAPQADVILLHASASELARVVGSRELRPLLLADTDPRSVTHAYAGMKWLAQRSGLMVYSLLLSAPQRLLLADRIAQQLSSCADQFLGAVLREWASLDPRQPASTPMTDELRQLARELLLAGPPGVVVERAADAVPLRPMRSSSLRIPAFAAV